MSDLIPTEAPAAAAPPPEHRPAPKRPNARFMLQHPAHLLALGLGSGLSPVAPGTAGTLWAWLAFLAMQQWLSPLALAAVVLLAWPVGW